jgi:hypothetical protein
MGAGEIASVVVSVVAACIGILAIWLSIVFYRMSTQVSESTKEAARDISAGVSRLETLFSTFYSDTFSIVKDTYADILQHAWPQQSDKMSQEAEEKAKQKVQVVEENIFAEITRILEKQKYTDAKLDKLDMISSELRMLLDKAIKESRKAEVEARQETVREYIVRCMKIHQKHEPRGASLKQIIEAARPNFSDSAIVNELFEMRKKGIVTWSAPEGSLSPDEVIQLRQ